MWSEFKKLLKDCMTEVDGKSYCPFRVGGFALTSTSLPTFIALSVYDVVFHSQHFDMVSFGTAFGAMMTGIAMLAGGVAFKARGETRDAT